MLEMRVIRCDNTIKTDCHSEDKIDEYIYDLNIETYVV